MSTVKDVTKDLKAGRFVIIVDDRSRENEGDLAVAAEKITPKKMNFLIRSSSGIVCMPAEGRLLDRLDIRDMVERNSDRFSTAFTVSIDAKKGVTTGVSAADRVRTIRTVLNRDSKPKDIARPGHVFPLRYTPGGVLRRAGHTEASVDLCRLAGLKPAAVIGEIMNSDGSMAKGKELAAFAQKHDIRIISIAELIGYRRKKEVLVERASFAKLPTVYGEFNMILYRSLLDNSHHVALVKGIVRNRKDVLVRVHSECLTGDVFRSRRCDCGYQLRRSMDVINRNGSGVVLYLRQEGRGIGLPDKIKAYSLQDKGLDTVEANHRLGFGEDLRDYGIGAQILADLGLSSIRLMTNNPRKIIGLRGYGLKVVQRLPLKGVPNRHNSRYLKTKKEKMGHWL
ncbi:bifunctional 3,4-dihydroxy-2-butanone-4-phosphate synthase/GTP cyclohydrolase II [Candidatus Woesearchaeota archaeon]|nr:bifunctional 3,4-dihydroxy-2-butanone-4-phosphate synthase/GTP cyclohydrolase II [Candidatus Woesearchaeota archaeon]